MDFFKHLDWGNWLYGLFAGAIGGGASAVSGAFSAAALDPKAFAVGSSQSFKLMGVMFSVNFVLSAAFYLKQNPLPSVKVETEIETVEQKLHPARTVTTTVKQTEMKEGAVVPSVETPKLP